MQDLELHGFGAAWVDRQQRGDVVQSTVSTPESFTSVGSRTRWRLEELLIKNLGTGTQKSDSPRRCARVRTYQTKYLQLESGGPRGLAGDHGATTQGSTFCGASD